MKTTDILSKSTCHLLSTVHIPVEVMEKLLSWESGWGLRAALGEQCTSVRDSILERGTPDFHSDHSPLAGSVPPRSLGIASI